MAPDIHGLQRTNTHFRPSARHGIKRLAQMHNKLMSLSPTVQKSGSTTARTVTSTLSPVTSCWTTRSSRAGCPPPPSLTQVWLLIFKWGGLFSYYCKHWVQKSDKTDVPLNWENRTLMTLGTVGPNRVTDNELMQQWHRKEESNRTGMNCVLCPVVFFTRDLTVYVLGNTFVLHYFSNTQTVCCDDESQCNFYVTGPQAG